MTICATVVRAVAGAIALLVALAASVDAKSGAPAVPAGLDPGGIAIAVIGEGIEYTAPEIARRLARDGEGGLIGRDFEAGDVRPYQPRSASLSPDVLDTNQIIAAMETSGSAHRLVPIRVAVDDLPQLARSVGFAVQTPARVVILPMTSLAGPRGELVRQAALRFRSVLFLVGLPELEVGAIEIPASTQSISIDNLIVVSVAVDARPEPHLAELLVDVDAAVKPAMHRVGAALAATAASAACAFHQKKDASAKEIKAAILARADPLRATKGRRVLTALCR